MRQGGFCKKATIQYKVRELAGGSTQTILRLFDVICWASLKTKNSGWFRLFGFGITWTHNSITPMFSGKRKKITIGNYRYGYLKPIPVVSDSVLREAIYLLTIKQPENCPNWIEGVGDCNKPECEFCRIQRCIDELESNVGLQPN